jgi:hypothetical protein
MDTKKRPNPFGKFKADVDRYADLRDERDAALKIAAAALALLETTMDSDIATQADIGSAELEYEGKVELLFDLAEAVRAACAIMVAESKTAVLNAMDPKTMPQA